MLDGMHILVIGAGIGGLAAAQECALRGATVTVLEQANAIREVGAGLQISPNGFAVLRALGLGDAVRGGALAAKSVALKDFRGGHVLRLDLTRLESQEYHFVHRADLIDILARGARDAGVDIRLNQKVDTVAPGRPAIVTLEDGHALSADLVIGADGLHSVVRRALNGQTAPFFTQQVAWRAIVPNLDGQGPEARVYMGPHRHVVMYPLRDGGLLNLVAVQEQASWASDSWSQTDDPQTVQDVFSDFCPEVRNRLADIEHVNLWGLFRHPVAGTWHAEGMTLLGDAAHPTLPFLAQGASLALEDAWVLTDALCSRDVALTERLSRYHDRRRVRVEKVIAAANGNAWKYHLSFPPLRWAAHTALRVGGAVAPMRMMRQFDWLYGHDVTR